MKPIIYSDFDHKYVILTWAHYYSSYGYYVYRRKLGGVWGKISSLLTLNFYKDIDVNRLDRFEYKITYLDKNNVETDLTLPVQESIQSPKRAVLGNVFKAIHKITSISFDLGKAEYCTILIKPVVGAKCPDCYNTETEDTTKRWCNTCKNTRIETGYTQFLNTPVRFGNQGQRLEANESGYDLKESMNVQIQDYPSVKNEDIVIRPSGQRYFIQGDVRRIQIQSLLVKQVVNIREILIDENQYYSL